MQMMGGPFLYLQIIVLVLIVILAVQKFIRFYGGAEIRPMPFLRSHHPILFLGIFSFVWGMFTQLAGIIIALNAIIEAADISPQLVLLGLRNSFVSPVVGISTLLFSALCWGILHAKYTRAVKPLD